MDKDARRELEATLRQRSDEGDRAGAVTLTIERYGPELYGYLRALVTSADEADDLFAELCAELWRVFPTFRWESSVRTFAYALARNLLNDHRNAPAQRPGRAVPLSHSPEALALAARVRTETKDFLRTEVRAEVARLRAELDHDERMLLILRVDRDLAWSEIARIMGVAEPALRKRYERIKTHLRELAASLRRDR